MTDRAQYIGRKVQLRKQLNDSLVVLRKLLAVDQEHAADPNQDDEERRLCALGIPEWEAQIARTEERLRLLGEMK
ncbi:hypothetical protein SAMN04515671_1098 [Nakamurella panacisegetis]|uniref:Uncharacterized protein n=1 Tax=Nakamurella panacisegetis TaxID=1090615 RepID=A0A1H0JYU3_9ACTN|nr:hypothetical protein [Nakamurella panacisegetis]SDO48814.1 hypothetical protein SAMN04515671_1098 [Nakamurella panacisegetis]